MAELMYISKIKLGNETYKIADAELTDAVSAITDTTKGLVKKVLEHDDQLSGLTENTVQKSINAAVSGIQGETDSTIADVEGAIAAMDFTGATGGSVITQVTQEDGKVSATTANLTSADKTVTVNGLDLKVNVDDTTIKVNGTTGALYVDPSATSVTGKDAIKVTDNNGKQVELVIAEANKVLTQTTDGLDTTLGLKFVKAADNTADGANKGKAVVQLTGVGNAVIGEFDATELVMDGVLDKVELDGSELTFTWNTDLGKDATTIDLSEYIKPYSAGDGLDLTEQTFSVKIKTDEKYLTVDEDGVASQGIDGAISTAVGAAKTELLGGVAESGNTLGKLDALINALDGKLTTTIEGLDANVTGTSADGHVAVNVVEEDGKITGVTVTTDDIASATALTAEITARKTVTGVNGDEYIKNTGAAYIKDALSLNDADVKLDAAIKALDTKLDQLKIEVEGTTLVITTPQG